jgi:hypothetical protein
VGSFRLSLENKGNSNELIKLKFEKGELLRFQTFIEADSILFIELPAYTDTLLNFNISQRKDLSYAETRALQQNWRSTSVYIEASTTEKKEYSGIRVVPLESTKYNTLPLRSSPLNLDLTLFNLLSYQRPKTSVRVHGKVLFPEQQQVQYSFGMFNLYFDPEMYENLDLYQMLRFMVRYNDPKTQVWIGDRLGTGNLHTMTGRGVRAQHTIKDNYNIYFNLIQNPYGPNIGSFVGFNTMLGKVAVNTGVTLESSGGGARNYYSLHLGGTYRFLRHHTIRLQTATTINRFASDRYLSSDTTVIGVAYRLGYFFNNNRLRFRIDNTNTNLTYLKNAGINRLDLDLSYKINDRSCYLLNILILFFHYHWSFCFVERKNYRDICSQNNHYGNTCHSPILGCNK